MTRKILYFDIETAPDESRLDLWKAYVEDKKKRNPDAKDSDLVPALLPEFCKVVALGWAINDEDIDGAVVGLERQKTDGTVMVPSEKGLITKFWQLISAEKPLIIGFNIFNFDLPVMFIRSAILGISPTRLIDRRPWGDDCIDLLQTRQHTNGGGGLKTLAKCLGLDVPEPEVDGSMAEELLTTDPERLLRYVKSDIAVTRQLYKFYQGYFVK